jgi:hypothetical protein
MLRLQKPPPKLQKQTVLKINGGKKNLFDS